VYVSAFLDCSRSGNHFAQYWTPDDPRVPFRGDDDAVSVHQRWLHVYGDGWIGTHEQTLRADADGDAVTGTVTMAQRVTGPGTPDVCESGPVTFSAQR
jgi:hypothetical protein